jgi:hypothetical protein
MPRHCHRSSFHHRNYIRRGVQTVEFLNTVTCQHYYGYGVVIDEVEFSAEGRSGQRCDQQSRPETRTDRTCTCVLGVIISGVLGVEV